MRVLSAIIISLAALSACTKAHLNLKSPDQASILSSKQLIEASKIGSPFKGSNLNFYIHPLYPNIHPLITYRPNTKSGQVLVMIDNGETVGQTPVNAFRFIAVDVQSNQYNVIAIKTKSGTNAHYSVGRITRYVFGSDEKLYVVTESGVGGGGHLIQYDPNTLTATDLGKPISINGKALDIYSISVGKDGHLYGGSFGGNGEVYVFEYNYQQIKTYPVQLATDKRYVAYVGGDDTHIYASCGINNWAVVALNKSTLQKTTLIEGLGTDARTELFNTDHGAIAKQFGNWYKLSGQTKTTIAASTANSYQRMEFEPHRHEDFSNVKLQWNDDKKELSYTALNGVSNTLQIAQVHQQIFPTGQIEYINDQLLVTGSKSTLLKRYDPNKKTFDVVAASPVHIYTIAGNQQNVFVGGYPKGNVALYSALSFKQLASYKLQEDDAFGMNGPMVIGQLHLSEQNYLTAAGNNDRITTTGSRDLAIGSVFQNQVRNFELAEFSQLEFGAMAPQIHTNNSWIVGNSKTGNDHKIYLYNPVSNQIEKNLTVPTAAPIQHIVQYNNSTLIITYGEYYEFIDIAQNKTLVKQKMGSGKIIYSITLDDQNKLWVIYQDDEAFEYHVAQADVQLSANSAILKWKDIALVKDADENTNARPVQLILTKNHQLQKTDAYISGLNSIYHFQF